MDEVAIVVVDYEHVGVARDGGLDEAAGKVREDFAGVRGEVGIDEVEFVVGRFGVVVVDGVERVVVVVVLEGGEGVGVACFGRVWERLGWFWFGAALVCSCLVEVALDEGE